MAQNNENKELTHVVGTFLIKAEGAFLNGGGLGQGEYKNTTVPKTFYTFIDRDRQAKVPYVSAQAWKRWLRDTYQEENPKDGHAVIKVLGVSKKGNPNQIGTLMNPVEYPEDDIFGYMLAKGQGKIVGAKEIESEEDAEEEGEKSNEKKGKLKVKSVIRTSPFHASILISLRKTGWEGLDKGFVKPRDLSDEIKQTAPNTSTDSLPYNTVFFNTQLQGVFGLNYSRLGVFRNEGDRIELNQAHLDKYVCEGKIKKIEQNRDIYGIVNNPRKERTEKLLRALMIMRGGAKQAQFATDVAPKAIVVAGLNCGNPIFNDIFEDTKNGPMLKIGVLEEIIKDYADRIVTPVYIGVRTEYLSNEKQLKDWIAGGNSTKVIVKLSSPKEAVESLIKDDLK